MRVEYFAETDTLYITLADKPGADAEEIAPGIVVDLDAEGKIVGIELDPASDITDPNLLLTNLDTRPLRLKPTA